jgi:hypothetical protein
MPEPATTGLTVALLKKPLEELYGAAKNGVKRKLKIAQSSAKIKASFKAISSVQKVKTLWSMDKELKLSSFYYPSRIIIDNARREISSIRDIDSSRSFVIKGTVGQGKSIFLRYLCMQELLRAQRIPIFLELRRYNTTRSFKDFLCSALTIYGIPHDAESFEYLAHSGKLTLLLDAFDEIESESVSSVVAELEGLVQLYPTLQIVVTSRPESGIEKSPFFRVYALAPLQAVDHKPFLQKIVTDPKRVEQLVTAISKSTNEIRTLLSTPLLLTLLVIVYNAVQEVPPTLSAFYEELFRTLLIRHDAQKPGFQRRRASRLNDADLKRLFEAFCYVARQRDMLVFNHSALESLLQFANTLTGISCSADGFAKDICKVVCLMQEEGLQYQFVHKSVAEFHAAYFVSRAPEDTAQKFYLRTSADFKKWIKWREELAFLSQIDRYRYLKYFYLPSATSALTLFAVSIVNGGPCHSLTPQAAREIFNRFSVQFVTKEVPGSSETIRHINGVAWSEGPESRLSHDLVSGILIKCLSLLKRDAGPQPQPPFIGPPTAEPFGDYMSANGILAEATNITNIATAELYESFVKAKQDVQREEQMSEFLDP